MMNGKTAALYLGRYCIGIVYIGTRIHEHPCRGKIAHPGGEGQRGVGSVGDGLLIRGRAMGGGRP